MNSVQLEHMDEIMREQRSVPVAWRYYVNGVHLYFSNEPPPDDSYDEGTLTPLYAAPEVAPAQNAAGQVEGTQEQTHERPFPPSKDEPSSGRPPVPAAPNATPRTNAEEHMWSGNDAGFDWMTDHARQLERELAEARHQIAAWNAKAIVAEQRAEQAIVRATAAEAALREARDMVADWSGYASEYFQQKHDLAGDLAKLDAILEGAHK